MTALHAEIRLDVEAWLHVRPTLPIAWHDEYRRRAALNAEEERDELEARFGAQVCRQPEEWQNPFFNQSNRPVVGLCHFEARAYAVWLHAQCGQAVRLPTEAEWEAAARGRERRPWPWDGAGERQLNADPAHLRRSSPVGVFPQADTPEGLTDLAGNVWEWTASVYTDRLEHAALVADVGEGMARRVVRGGSCDDATADSRAAHRDHVAPGSRLSAVGFRLVVSYPKPNAES